MLLRDVCGVHSGYTARGGLNVAPDGFVALQQSEVTPSGAFDVESAQRIDVPSGKYEVRRGDVLFRSRGQNTTAWAIPDSMTEPAVAVMPLFILRPDDARLDPSYLAWALNQSRAQQYFRQSAQGQTIQMVSKPVLESTPIDVPPLAQQRQIAAIAALATREYELERRLIDRRQEHLALQMANIAQSEYQPTPKNRTVR